jgi:putative nucleotidyltransferase with HDIG domain
MVAKTESRHHNPFLPTWRHSFNTKDLHLEDSLRDKLDDLKKIRDSKERAQKLIFYLGEHHLNTLYHSYEVAIIAYKLFEYYYEGIVSSERLEPIRRRVFKGGLFHDIGKLGVNPEILDREEPLTEEEKNNLVNHGKIGGIILDELDFRELNPFALEHHIGNSKIKYWTKEQLKNRHPLVEFISLADLLSSALDPKREYKKPKNIKKIIKMVRKRTKKGIFPPDLEKAFLKFISENPLPPFSKEYFRQDKMYKWFFDVE